MPLNPLSDNTLMIAVRSGNLDQMGLLFERYNRPLFGFCYRMTGHAPTSEDLVQSVFYRMLKYRHTFTGDGEFRTWMYHVARNVLADHHQQNRQRYDSVDDWASRIGGGTEADEALHRTQEREMVHEALLKLKPDQREILILSRFQELKYEEIARILHTTEGAVKVKVHRAMNELKKVLLEAHEL
ncbi:RNA polymerase sigma factor [Siphonobacter aquaeclarae]|uniref:RNA polymerase sigma-70 factor, ECF subfamily n=1 Tax=Siphonobacter aquaeclarae TaxID=563176 RepID=A0A1G9PNC1_9BACT|nr:sigma-70 family RNA polymerase sigma factor [Siphonobacter aquaeclarae]SDL99565.1 RNA polymerase sigma-70 factor, ECF subfamily [Siphonobacter aquaeclarae]